MTPASVPRVSWYHLVVVLVLGFASGLPLALTGQAMQAWLSVSGVDIATIGFLSLVGLPYTFKFLWAPLMDRFELPWLGRRRGWLVLTQLGLAGALWLMADTSPSSAIRTFALLAVLVAFASASQDVVIDAYRTDLLRAHERGMGASMGVLGYRLAMTFLGSVAFLWVEPPTATSAGGGWTWPEVYRLVAAVMAGAAILSAIGLPRLQNATTPASAGRRDLQGFAAVVLAVVIGFLLSERYAPLLANTLLAPLLSGSSMAPALQAKWISLFALVLGMAFTIPLAAWAARAARFETLLSGLRDYFSQSSAAAFLIFIVLYKLGDVFAGSLLTPFLLTDMKFSGVEFGVANKTIGLWLNIVGSLIGGVAMLKLGLWRSLMLFGILQMVSNLGFWWLAVSGKGVLPGLVVPAFDWGFVRLAQATTVDGGLMLVIAIESVTGGMGTAAIVAFLMSLCNRSYSATQFALLSAFASVGRVWVGPLAGVLAESIGWPTFFVVSTAAALPALCLLYWLRQPIRLLEFDPKAPRSDD